MLRNRGGELKNEKCSMTDLPFAALIFTLVCLYILKSLMIKVQEIVYS